MIILSFLRALAPEFLQRLLYLGRLPVVDGRKIDASAQAVSDLVSLIRGDSAPPSIEESRRQLAAMADKFDDPCPASVTKRDITLPGADGPRPARTYDAGNSSATMLYLHGGGWVQGSIETHDGLCGKLAAWSGLKIISYDYRLAPEHAFPAGCDDVLECYKALTDEESEHGTSADRLVVGGDSAGANLAATLLHDLAENGLSQPAGQLLIYPAVDARMQSQSMTALANQPLLPVQRIEFFLENYLPKDQDRLDPRVSPLFSPHLAGQAPAFIVAGGHDPLWDDAFAYVEALQNAGVATTLTKFEGQIHGFASITKVIPQGNIALRQSADWLRNLFPT